MHGGLLEPVDELILHHKPDPLHTIVPVLPDMSHEEAALHVLNRDVCSLKF